MQGTDVTRTNTDGNTDVVAAPAATVAKVRKGNAVGKPAAKPASKVGNYRVVTEAVSSTLLAATKAAWAQGKRGTALAAAIAPVRAKCVPGATGCTSGQATHLAMLAGCAAYRGQAITLATYGSKAKGAPATPAALAKAVAAMRNAGHSWVLPRATFGITEATCRAAYMAATGVPHNHTGVGAWAWRQAPGK
jgi:hypothetical protein